MLALGSGVTLAAVLNVLHTVGIPAYALCPDGDFVRGSRWYRPLPGEGGTATPENLQSILEHLSLEQAVLLPCSDDWLRAVANLPEPLAERFPSSTPGEGVHSLVNKWQFSQLLTSLQIPQPRTLLISAREHFDALDDRAFQGAILKPLSSVEFASRHGVKGYLVENREQAAALFQQLDLPVMLQEFIPGPPTAGYFVDGFRDRTGRISAMFARRRLRMYPPRLGNSTYIESVPLREVESAALFLECLLEKMSYRGIFSAEFKFDDRDGVFKLIEINARPWWYVEFAAKCGVDVCSMAYFDALGQPVEPVTTYEVGRRCVFALNDLRAWKDGSFQKRVSLASLLRSWARCDSTPFHWNDPRPGLRYLGGSVYTFLRSALGGKPSPTVSRSTQFSRSLIPGNRP